MPDHAAPYLPETLTRAEVDAGQGNWLLQFGANGCPHCVAAEPHIRRALGDRTDLHHIRIEDGRGRPLGRSFAVKCWPTLILLRNGREVARVIRPRSSGALSEALELLD
ncbi:MAG: thioredoxin family protein [Lautropia sp.]|nr:thioredoxin family protein [Lautropia sp.]